MDRDAAVRIENLVHQGADTIRESISVARGNLTDASFHEYCKAAGAILGAVELDLLKPYVYAHHPDLASKAPSDPKDQAYIEGLRPKFAAAAARARGDDQQPRRGPYKISMDRKVAERIIPMLVGAAQRLSDTIEVFKSTGSQEQVRSYTQSVGNAIFAIDDLLRPIVNEHPDLHP